MPSSFSTIFLSSLTEKGLQLSVRLWSSFAVPISRISVLVESNWPNLIKIGPSDSRYYAARYVAKNIVAAGLADYCEIQVSYAIGVAKPTSIHVETFNSEKISKEAIVKIVEEEFDLRPKSLINMLDLKRPIYLPTAAYGHFGRSDIDLSWEKTDKAADIAQ